MIQDKTIKAILVTECEDDAAFFNRAKSIINEVLKNQSTDLSGIDTVSEQPTAPTVLSKP